MTMNYSFKKKLDPLSLDWPENLRYKPTENQHISQAYEYITGISFNKE